MADEKRPKETEPKKTPQPQKGQDPQRSGRQPDTEPPKEKRRDDL